MPRPLRVQFPGAIYHVMNRGDRREPVFLDDQDRARFLDTLGEACEKTAWQIHAFCLMNNHFHLVIETPRGNLIAGMKWLLGTYTARFNRRHRLFGHLFSGRYKAVVIDERGGGYLRTACDYVHLNPFRAGLIPPGQPLSVFPWSSYPWYLSPARRPRWLRVDRLLGEHGLVEDSAKARMALQKYMEERRQESEGPPGWAALRRGWRLGASDFLQILSERLGRRGQPHEFANQRQETDEQRAQRMVAEWLQEFGWSEDDLLLRGKAAPEKIEMARRLRRETPMTRHWIARRLGMGSASYITHLLARKE